MEIKKLLTLILFITGAAAFAGAQEYDLPPPDADKFIYYEADELTYDTVARQLSLFGNVNVVLSQPDTEETRLYSQNLMINQIDKTVSSDGDVLVEQDSGQLRGQNIKYNYETKDLEIENMTAEYPPIRLLGAQKGEMKSGKQTYKSAKVTCCDQENPHYYLKAGYIAMTPEKKIFGANALLYLSDIPVFYVPIFWRSLDSQKPFTTYVDFTQSGKTGFGLLTSTVFYPIKNLRATVNLDGYLKSGFGYGAQLQVRNSDKVSGNMEAYAIDDQEYGKSRWGVNGGYSAILYDNSNWLNRDDGGAIYSSQGQFRAVSDPYFNDTFFRSNPYKFMPDQDVSFAFSRQTRKSIFRVSYSQKDRFNSREDKYETVERTLPRVEFQAMPFMFPLGIVNNFNVNLYNTQILDGDYNQTARAYWKSARPFKLSKKFTFTPYVDFDERVVLEDEGYDNDDTYVSRLGGGANLRAELITGSFDVGYRYTKRFETNKFKPDNDAADKGDEENKITIQNYFRPTLYTYFRVGTAYDILDNDTDWTFDDRLDPIFAELGYNMSNGAFNIFLRNDYDVKDGNQAFIMQSDFKLFKASRGVFGMTNHADDINSYLFNTKIWFRPAGSTWYFDAGMDFELKQGSLHAYSKNFRLYKDLHDAHLEFSVEDRNDNLSFAFRINILCGKKYRDDTFSKEDRYWSPWREPGDLR
ncbi:LPS-assembly protein [Elusimicrobium simillimum]|uniref:LPS export ABC transporter periplasmic protein LptC n=1 Tax=Elusimicrobium simillimum TaxID=3143438 RepID=UPI003C6F7C97